MKTDKIDKLTLPLIGVYGINNVSLVDRPYSILIDTGYDMLNKAAIFNNQTPIAPSVITATQGDADDIIMYGPDVTVDDLVARLQFIPPSFNGTNPKNLGVIGYLITHRFTNSQVAPPFDLHINHLAQNGAAGPILPIEYTELARNIQVTPTGGANSVSEYIILNLTPGQLLNYDVASKGYTTATEQNQAYASILNYANVNGPLNPELGLIQNTGFIFKGAFLISQTITVTPIMADETGIKKVHDLLCAVIK